MFAPKLIHGGPCTFVIDLYGCLGKLMCWSTEEIKKKKENKTEANTLEQYL